MTAANDDPLHTAVQDVAKMAGHTSGPWSVATSGRGNLCVVADDAWICGEIDNQPHEMPTTESTANAHLIAAAPEMYEALESLLVVAVEVGGLPEYGQVLTARRALAKARGES